MVINMRKNKGKVIISILFIQIIMFGCSQQGELVDLREVDSVLVGRKIPTSTFIYKPYNMVKMDNMFVVHDGIDSNIFKFFSYPDVKFLFSWGKIGFGPDEISYVNNTGFLGRGNTFSFTDDYDFKTYEFVTPKKLKLVEKIELSNTFGPLNNLSLLKDSVFIANTYDPLQPEKEYTFLYPERKTGNTFGEFPELGYEFESYPEKESWFLRRNVVHRDKQRIMVFYLCENLFRIYDFKGKLKKEIMLNVEGPPGPEYYWRTFGKPYSNGKHIFVLYTNKIIEPDLDYLESLEKDLLVLNWDGEIIKRFDLDISISDFVVSEKDRKIYGITLLGGEDIVEFDLPDL